MCLALPRGRPQEPPAGILRGIGQWAGFSALVTRIVLSGLAAWLRHRWRGRA